MADSSEVDAVAAALLTVLRGDITKMVPSWAQGMIPPDEAQKLAAQLAPVAITTLDNHRLEQKK